MRLMRQWQQAALISQVERSLGVRGGRVGVVLFEMCVGQHKLGLGAWDREAALSKRNQCVLR